MANYPNACGAGQDMKVDGNTGLGEIFPTHKLHVRGETLHQGPGGWEYGQTASSYYGDTSSGIQNVWGGSFTIKSNNAINIQTTASNRNISISANGTGVVHVGSKVGIGTTTPAQMLHVNGAIVVGDKTGECPDGTIFIWDGELWYVMYGVMRKILFAQP